MTAVSREPCAVRRVLWAEARIEGKKKQQQQQNNDNDRAELS